MLKAKYYKLQLNTLLYRIKFLGNLPKEKNNLFSSFFDKDSDKNRKLC